VEYNIRNEFFCKFAITAISAALETKHADDACPATGS
jgi:hypothetical protein